VTSLFVLDASLSLSLVLRVSRPMIVFPPELLAVAKDASERGEWPSAHVAARDGGSGVRDGVVECFDVDVVERFDGMGLMVDAETCDADAGLAGFVLIRRISRT
jgi:hypothetical protein